MGRRTLLLIASILVAAVGTALIFMYVRGADDRAKGDAAMVEVVVARTAIPSGTTVSVAKSSNYFTTEERPRGGLPDDAFGQISDLDSLGDRATTGAISAKSVITASNFGGEGQQSASGVPAGKFAQSIQLSDPSRVAGIITPGVKVAVIATFINASSKKQTALTLMSGIPVIAVGSNGAPNGATDAVAPTVIDLAVSEEQAVQIRLAEQSGELSLLVQGDGAEATGKNTDTLTFTGNEPK